MELTSLESGVQTLGGITVANIETDIEAVVHVFDRAEFRISFPTINVNGTSYSGSEINLDFNL